MKDVMVDIETLGNGKNGLICQIGACYFDRETGEIGRKYKVNIDPKDAERYGCELDASTVMWWLSQSEQARKSILADPKVSLVEGLMGFHEFIKGCKTIWSHATFDFVMINESCRRMNLPPLPFRKARDIRTLVDLGKVTIKKVQRGGTHHDALDDAIYQVKYCVECFNSIKGKQNASS
jgi:hypothetical protein